MVHQATVISIEESTALSDAHLASALRHNVSNNAVCRKAVDDSLMRKFWESPEFVRFQVLSGGLVDLVREHGVKSLKVGGAPVTTSFVHVTASRTSCATHIVCATRAVPVVRSA